MRQVYAIVEGDSIEFWPRQLTDIFVPSAKDLPACGELVEIFCYQKAEKVSFNTGKVESVNRSARTYDVRIW